MFIGVIFLLVGLSLPISGYAGPRWLTVLHCLVLYFLCLMENQKAKRAPLQPMTPEEAQAMRASMARFAEKQKSGAATGCTVIDALCMVIGFIILVAVGKWLVAIGVLLP
jgi:hypothetical protein